MNKKKGEIQLEMKQIIVVTDGQSNIGGNPVSAAKEAKEEGVIVNAIGIIDGQADEALWEVEKIAQGGGGIWENTMIQELGQTMHGVTQKTVHKTIETIVGKQLKEIIGTDLENIPPKERSKIVDYMDKVSEEIGIKCCIVMDCSGSMKNKMAVARQSIIELMNSLKGRKGKNEIAIIAYPGKNGECTDMISDFTQDIQKIKEKVFLLKAGGTTPTAAAINHAISLFKMDVSIKEEVFLEESMV